MRIVPDVDNDEYFSAGDATVERTDVDAFSQSPEAIEKDFELDANFKSGNAIFRNDHSGQGPIMNAATCQGCHLKDGRGNPPVDPTVPMDSMVLKLSLGNDASGEPIPDPTYGLQLQTFGFASFEGGDTTAGLARFGGGATEAIGEAFAFIDYEPVTGQYGDGTTYELRRPVYKVRDLSYGEFADGIAFLPRVAPQMIGLGLLEAIEEEEILALADPEDANNNGISGRAVMVEDVTTGENVLGRFGHKSTSGSVLMQTALAYRRDIGVTNRFATEEPCTDAQLSCTTRSLGERDPHPPHPPGVDISDEELALVEFYSRLLAVPARRGYEPDTAVWDESVLAGRTLFFETGCADCHRQGFETGTAQGSVLGEIKLSVLFPDPPPIEVLSEQRIWPYTDLLLHDMGGSCEAVARESADGGFCAAGENCTWVSRCEGLADPYPDGDAEPSEWRTAPLWGLGLALTVNPKAGFLHDGRARTIEEAILWHGGEAAQIRDSFLAMEAAERESLLTFLESL